ncbi:S66 peptidase family protein [Pseudoalteromonas sp. T1lg75]|uniref:S66 peptidase family protein n=1 Tax=Pseudoalteromonas sp. T1lg75 TaxID=2077102 RepID=UPI000CF703E6|nr:LD-carboxypeptidase [Pseudoalteromonas sp. T1lg75]
MNKRAFLKTCSLLGIGLMASTGAQAIGIPKLGAQSVIKPKTLQKGGTIALVSPSAATAEHKDLLLAQQLIKALGYKVKVAEHVLARRGHLAGTDAQRAADLNAQFADPEVDALFCLRGGSGAARLLPLLDYPVIAANPKPLLGYSDITALHNALLAQTGLISFHGPNATSEWDPFNVQQFQRLFEQRQRMHYMNLPRGEDELVNRDYLTQTITPGKVSGRLVGGNLTVLTALAGSPYLPSFDGAILFLEDTEEAPYRIDRMMSTLKLMGALDKIAGFVFGDCNQCTPSAGYGSLSLDEIFADYIKPLGIPAYRGAMIGHVKQQFILPVGAQVTLDADAGSITLAESVFS